MGNLIQKMNIASFSADSSGDSRVLNNLMIEIPKLQSEKQITAGHAAEGQKSQTTKNKGNKGEWVQQFPRPISPITSELKMVERQQRRTSGSRKRTRNQRLEDRMTRVSTEAKTNTRSGNLRCSHEILNKLQRESI